MGGKGRGVVGGSMVGEGGRGSGEVRQGEGGGRNEGDSCGMVEGKLVVERCGSWVVVVVVVIDFWVVQVEVVVLFVVMFEAASTLHYPQLALVLHLLVEPLDLHLPVMKSPILYFLDFLQLSL